MSACRAGATCTATTVVPLIAPMTQFLGRRTQLDRRVTKVGGVDPVLPGRLVQFGAQLTF